MIKIFAGLLLILLAIFGGQSALSQTFVTAGGPGGLSWVINGPRAQNYNSISIGDSRVANDISNAGNTLSWTSIGIKNFADFAINQATFRSPVDLGTGGETTAGLLARTDSIIAGNSAATVYILSSVNDRTAGNNFTVQQSIDNYTAILDKLTAAHRFVIISEIPRDQSAQGGTNVLSNQQYQNHYDFHLWLQNTAPGLYPGNVVFANTWDLVVATQGQASGYASGMSYDGLHLGTKGALTASTALATKLSTWFPSYNGFTLLATSNSDQYSVSTPHGTLVANPLLSGTGGTISGTGVTGTVPDSWTIDTTGCSGISATLTQSAGSNGRTKLNITISGTTATVNGNLKLKQTVSPSNLSLNDSVAFPVQLTVDAGATGAIAFYPEFRLIDASNTYTSGDVTSAGALAGTDPLVAGIIGIALPPYRTIPAPAGGSFTLSEVRVYIQFVANVAATGTYHIEGPTPRKVN